MKVCKVRDISLIDIGNDSTMVIACDSCGGIGMKEGDALKVPPFFTGKFTVRVALMEVISSGAEVVTVTDSVCCEMEPTGSEIIKGIKSELQNAGIDDVVLTGSTEENFPTTATGLGVTVVGIAQNKDLKVCNVKKQSIVISVGIPKVGSEIGLEKDEDIVSYSDIIKLMKCGYAYEIVPVGSKGVLYEAELLASYNNMKFELYAEVNVDIYKTCGPSTVIIAAVDPESVENIRRTIKNVNVLGRLTL